VSTGEWLTRHDERTLIAALDADERVLCLGAGARAVSADELLRRIEPRAASCGVTSVTALTGPEERHHVYQACRPHVQFHPVTGQSAHAEGRGWTREQARLSCLMEAIERYSAEPRNERLIRGSYSFLKRQHRVARPDLFLARAGAGVVSEDEPLMWAQASDVDARTTLLIPAQCVYNPFATASYQTRSVIAGGGSSGLASGATLLEATLHGLYELIERFYTSELERGRAELEALWENELDLDLGALPAGCDVQVYSARSPRLRGDLAMVIAIVVGEEGAFMGRCVTAQLTGAVQRAYSEALQARVVTLHGARAHLGFGAPPPTTPAALEGAVPAPEAQLDAAGELVFPDRRSLRLAQLRERVGDRRFANLGEELSMLRGWLADAGFPALFVANLTRIGLDVPVVRCVVPGLPMSPRARGVVSNGFDERTISSIKYGYTLDS
jgi:YcaO-like protein with predicted kinase domain